MRVLGIDPALNNTGWAIIDRFGDDYKVIGVDHISNSSNNYYGKLENNFKRIDELIKEYKPDIFAIEETFVNMNAVSSLKLGVVRGVFFACAINNGIKIIEFKPNEIKKVITGNGKADKRQVDYMVKMLIPKAEPKTSDESDAIAIALTCLFLNRE